MTEFGDGPPVQRTCAAADRTGHAILHTLYGQSLQAQRAVLHRVFRHRPDHERRTASAPGVIAWKLDDGTLHRFRAKMVVLATGGYGRAYFSATSAHTCTGDGNGMVARAGPAAAGHGVRAVPPDRHLRRRLPDHRGRARRGRLPHQLRGRALHGALCAHRQGPRLARRGLALHDASRSARAAASGRRRTTSTCTSTISTRRCCTSGCPASPRSAKIFAGVDVTTRADPGAADRALQHGRHPDQLLGRGARTRPRTIPTASCPA